MKLLPDTHIWIWNAGAPENLPKGVAEAIRRQLQPPPPARNLLESAAAASSEAGGSKPVEDRAFLVHQAYAGIPITTKARPKADSRGRSTRVLNTKSNEVPTKMAGTHG